MCKESFAARSGDTTYGANRAIPEEVFQRALYMTGEFEK
jgi:hypothetical protein